MTIRIAPEPADSPIARELIAELEAILSPQYPDESRHGYSVEKLLREGVHFLVIWDGAQAAGCGGIQLYGSKYGELKRMYVRPAYRGQGLGRRLIDALADFAGQNGVRCLRLETGIHQLEAIRLYEGYSFRRRGPFGDYREDPLSLFFEKPLARVD